MSKTTIQTGSFNLAGLWGIARSLIIEVWRMRLLMIFVGLLTGAYTLGLGYSLYAGNDTPPDRIQTFIGWSLRIAGLLLSFVTLFVAAVSITRDIEKRNIHTIVTKSVGRLEVLLGKFLGLALLNLAFLTVNGLLIYGVTMTLAGKNLGPLVLLVVLIGLDVILSYTFLMQWLAHRKTIGRSGGFVRFAGVLLVLGLLNAGLILGTRSTMAHGSHISDTDQAKIDHVILTARRSVKAEDPDIIEAVRKKVEQVVQEQIKRNHMTDPDEIGRMRNRLIAFNKQAMERYLVTISPMEQITWHFRNIRPRDRENGYVFVRYKPEVSYDTPDGYVISEWWFGPEDPTIHGGEPRPRRDRSREITEFGIPASAVSPEGDLYLTFRNPLPNNPNVILTAREGLEILYTVGDFEGNLLRSLLMIFLRLLFLALFSLAAGAFLSYPVAILVILVVFVLGMSSSFITQSVEYQTPQLQKISVRGIMKIFPPLSDFNPVILIEKGRDVSFAFIGESLAKLVGIYGGLTFLIGFLLFKFREMARVIV